MFFERQVPRQAQSAYRKEAWASLIVGVYSGAIGPYLMIVARGKLHAPDWQIGLMTAAPAVGSVFALFWANAMEGKNKMPFALVSWISGRAMFLAMIFCYTPLRFTICVVAAQILVTVSGPAYASIMKDIYPDEHRGRIMSYCRVILAAAMIAATLIAGDLLEAVSYRYIFAIGGLFGIASALVFGRIELPSNAVKVQRKKPPTVQFLRNAFAILREDGKFRWFAMSIFTYGFGTLLVSPLYPIFAVDRLHIQTWQQSWLTGMFNVVWTASFLYWGRYVDIKSPLRAAAISVFATGIIPINYFISGYVGSAWALVPATLVNGYVSAGIELSYFNAVMQFSDEARVSHYQALFSCLFGVRGIIAPLIGTVMISSFRGVGWDVGYIFLIALAIMWAGGVMQVVGGKRKYTSV